MMHGKTDAIVWDYEWIGGMEIPSWINIASTYDSLEDSIVLTPRDNIMMYFEPEEFPITSSYIVEMDVYNTLARLVRSFQGGVIFSQTISGSKYLRYVAIKRDGGNMISGTSYYVNTLSTNISEYRGSKTITNDLRYIITLTFDNNNNYIKLKVNNDSVRLDSGEGNAPRGIFGRYTQGGVFQIYSIKIKKL